MVSIGELKEIGVVHSQYKERKDAPSQGRQCNDESTLEVFEAFEPALQDVEQCSHLIVLYWQDKADREVLRRPSRWGSEVRGVFATRSPSRPNPVGLCVVNLVERKGRFLKVTGMDALDGSPLIDIKPYFEFDCIQNSKVGWRDKRA